MINVAPSDKKIDNHIVLSVNDVNSEFYKVEYYYDGMKFADQENEDGSMNMSFNYEIVEGEIAPDRLRVFEKFIGDTLLQILEDQMKRQEVVYKGGTGEAEILSE